MKKIIFIFYLLSFSWGLDAQVSFSDASSWLLDDDFNTFQALGVADLNGDGLDDILRFGLDSLGTKVMYIEYQEMNGSFSSYSCSTCIPILDDVWGVCVGDVDNNGINDILFGGYYYGLRLMKANLDEPSFTQSSYFPNVFLQGVNFVDINNDGFLDLFACHDEGFNATFQNDGNGAFVQNFGLFFTNPSAGNYGSVWSDYDNDGDVDLHLSKCKIGNNDPTSAERLNRMYQNNNASATDVSLAAGVLDGEQSWSADFGDVDNDGDMDLFVLNHTGSNRLYEQAGSPAFQSSNEEKRPLRSKLKQKRLGASTGVFIDMIQGSGLEASGVGDWQSIFADFNNDGFLDLLVTGVHTALYLNDGDKTFTEVPNFGTNFPFQNFALGDLNHDGFIDILGSYSSFNAASTLNDKLLINNGNGNNFIGFTLEGTSSNRSGVGAKLALYGAWGVQVREVRSGVSYGIQNSLNQHFGLGAATSVDSLVVVWPSGIVQSITANLAINTYLEIVENEMLPLDLLSFEAKKEGKSAVAITWSAIHDGDNAYFTVEHSPNGIDFEVLGTIDDGGGEQEIASYVFYDNQPNLGVNYYRLAIIDLSGETAYSETQVVRFDEEIAINLFPNPIFQGEDLQMSLSSLRNDTFYTASYEVLDAKGSRILLGAQDISISNNLLIINTKSLLPGLYVGRFFLEDNTFYTSKFLVIE